MQWNYLYCRNVKHSWYTSDNSDRQSVMYFWFGKWLHVLLLLAGANSTVDVAVPKTTRMPLFHWVRQVAAPVGRQTTLCLVIFTRWQHQLQICCHTCFVIRQMSSLIASGWWLRFQQLAVTVADVKKFDKFIQSPVVINFHCELIYRRIFT